MKYIIILLLLAAPVHAQTVDFDCQDLNSFTDRAQCNNISPTGQVFFDMLDDAETTEEQLGVIAIGVVTLSVVKLLGGIGEGLSSPQYATGFSREDDGP